MVIAVTWAWLSSHHHVDIINLIHDAMVVFMMSTNFLLSSVIFCVVVRKVLAHFDIVVCLIMLFYLNAFLDALDACRLFILKFCVFLLWFVVNCVGSSFFATCSSWFVLFLQVDALADIFDRARDFDIFTFFRLLLGTFIVVALERWTLSMLCLFILFD